jgi:outer membrane receptor protein involved in Fe transport
MGTILYPEAWRIATTKGRPRDRLNAGVHFDDGPFSGQVSAHYYGKIVTLLSEEPYLLRTRRGKTTFDIDFGYEFRSGLGINIGMENLLNAFPDRNVEGFDSGGRNPYPSDAWGRNGRFIYCRASVSI